MTLFHPETLYLYLGEQGSWSGPPTFNGGGQGTIGVSDRSYYVSGGSGGGASDLRLMSGPWDDSESLKSRVMISAGGAGSAYYRECGGFIQGGHGGDLIGSDGTICTLAFAATITKAIGAKQDLYGIGASSWGINGSFGIGGNCGNHYHGSGGSGGYYGGGSGGAVNARVASGSGGSSYISGHENCKAISKDYNETNMKHLDTSVHFSGFKFYSTTLLNGNSRIPGFTSNTFENGHNGYGQARITVLETMNPISKCFCSYIKFSYILLFTDIELSEELIFIFQYC